MKDGLFSNILNLMKMPTLKVKFNLSFKIILYLLSSIFLFWFFSSLIVYHYIKTTMIKEGEKKALNLAEYIANGVSGSLILGETVGIRAETSLFKNDEDLAVVKVEGGKDVVVADIMNTTCLNCHNESVFETYKFEGREALIRIKGEHIIVATSDVGGIDPTQPIGKVYVFLSLSRVKNVIKSAILRGALILLLIAVFFLTGGYILTSYSVSKPLKESAKTLEDVINESVKIVGEVKTGTAEQAASVNELATSSEEVAGSATQIADMAKNTEIVSFESAQVIDESERGLQEVLEEMERTREKIEGLAGKILELSDMSQRIGKVNALIEEISEQTRLLAVNASIEATGAGEVGRRFGVVASEIKNLSLRTREATRDVASLIDGILSSIAKTVMATEDSTKAFNILKEKIERIKTLFSKVKEKSEEVLKVASDISNSTSQQKLSSTQMAQAISEVRDVANQIAEYASNLSEHIEKLRKVVESLERLI